MTNTLTRRGFTRLGLAASAGLVTACSRPAAEVAAASANTITQAATEPVAGLDNSQLMELRQAGLERRVSGFRARRWPDYFPTLKNSAILVDTQARVLHFWSEDQSIYKMYPASVPLSPELTRTGRTQVIRKRVGRDWRPTPNMLQRDPDLPEYVGPGPQNPLGTHALYLSWQYYRIHGTNDERKIGRKSSNGCVGLYNEDIEEVFNWSSVGTQVLVV